MKLNKILKNTLLVVLACFALSACATKKVSTSQMQGDVYTGTDTVEYLASGVVPLVSDLPAHKELDYPGIFYFQKNNFNSFYKELFALLQDSNLDNYKEKIIL